MNDSTVRPRQSASMRPACLWAFLPALVLVLSVPSAGDAQVATNINPSDLPSCPGPCGLGVTIVTPLPPGQGGTITITGGARPGDGLNLFHSFGRFDVGTGDIANFLNDTHLPTLNILSRVTGGNPSQIYGTIRTTDFPGANLFLMNPAGVLFGATAVLDLGAVSGSAVRQPGSFYATTADYLNLGDDNGTSPFYADPLQTSILSVAPVVAFGFLGPNAASIAIQGGNLEVSDGQTLSFIGGPGVFTPDTGVPVPSGVTMTAGRLSTPNGLIYMETVTAPGEIPLPTLSGSPLGSPVSFPGSENAVIYVQSGELVMKGASLLTATTGPTSGEPIGINVEVAGQFTMQNASGLSSSTTGEGQAGAINVSASTLTLDGASIQNTTSGDGRGGDISIINAQSVSLTNGAQIVSDTKGGGAGGTIAITTTNTPDSSVTISGYDGTGTLIGVVNPFFGVTSGLFSTASAAGQGGQISITAPNVTLDNEGTIETTNSGVGKGGDIAINSTTVTVGLTIEAFILSSTGYDFTNSTVVGTGIGGNVTIQGLSGAADSAADKVALSSGAQITSIAGGPSSGGDILIISKDVQLDTGASINSGFTDIGDGGNITVNVDTLSLTNSAAIKSLNESVRLGKGGDITLQGLPEATVSPATSVTLSSGANITSLTSAPDPGGDILIISKGVQLGTGTSINSSTSGSGAGGNITAKVYGLELMNDASITSKTSSLEPRPLDSPEFAQGGNITVERLPASMDNPATSVTLTTGSRIATETFGSGHGGQVAITSESLTINNGIIATATSDTGDGGDIVVNVLEALLLGGGSIKSTTSRGVLPDPDALRAGNGGRVTVQGLAGDTSKADSFTASDRSGIISTSTGEGRLGNIEVYAKTVRLTDVGLIQVGTQLDTGSTAGDVFIDADSVSISGGSSIRSQVKFANAGTVTITADQLTLNNGTIEVSTHGIGKGGDVFLNVGSMSLANGATITSSSFLADSGAGDAGNVRITASGAFTSNASTIATSAENAKGGDILIDAQNVQLSNGTLISASSRSSLLPDGAGNAGNIKITSASNVVMQNSSVTTEASAASGGSIEIDASDAGMIQLINSQVSTSVGGRAGELGASDGGNITIDPQFVILQNSQILAQAVAGAGGNITIVSNVFLADPGSLVDASSQLGISGTVNILSPVQNIGGELTALTQEFSSAAALLAQQCAARVADGKFSTFMVAAREGLPAEPGGFLASPSLTSELFGSRLSGRDSQSQLPAITVLFPKYDARPIQLARFGDSCHR